MVSTSFLLPWQGQLETLKPFLKYVHFMPFWRCFIRWEKKPIFRIAKRLDFLVDPSVFHTFGLLMYWALGTYIAIVKYYQKVFHLICNVFSIGSRNGQDDNFGSERGWSSFQELCLCKGWLSFCRTSLIYCCCLITIEVSNVSHVWFLLLMYWACLLKKWYWNIFETPLNFLSMAWLEVWNFLVLAKTSYVKYSTK